MPKRTGTNDKDLIQKQSYTVCQNLTATGAILKLALFQIDHAEPEEFFKLRNDWDVLLRLIQEKIEIAAECNSEIGYLAATSVPKEESH